MIAGSSTNYRTKGTVGQFGKSLESSGVFFQYKAQPIEMPVACLTLNLLILVALKLVQC